METFQRILARKLSAALTEDGWQGGVEVTPATDPRFGDYQTNIALVLGKQRGENPRVFAEQIIKRLDVSDICLPPKVAGAGFINFVLRPEAVAERATALLQDPRLGVPEAATRHRIVIDFGSPNVAKPMHIGHIR